MAWITKNAIDAENVLDAGNALNNKNALDGGNALDARYSNDSIIALDTGNASIGCGCWDPFDARNALDSREHIRF